MIDDLDSKVKEYIEIIHTIGFENFQTVVSLSRWPDGKRVQEKDKPALTQALLLYETRHVPLEQRTGFIERSKKR